MTDSQNIKTSKFLSLVLRHKPETIGLALDENGWANTRDLIKKAYEAGIYLTLDRLKELVEQNDKQRFVFSPDFNRIRANQGHSLPVNLQLAEQEPPAVLYHGTAEKNISLIKQLGLLKGRRHHVHLSTDTTTARSVGMRYGKPVVLHVNAGKMHQDGYKFYLSANGVWLTDFVLPQYITFPT
jgi:putative RNA 2'-phosphotransferase